MHLTLVVACVLWCFCFVLCQKDSLSNDCVECDRGKCKTKEATDCVAGITRDNCDCCQVCAQPEGEFCDLPGDIRKYGKCGAHLNCVKQDSGSGICVCENQDVVCGSNNVDYDTICKLREDKIRTGNKDLIVQHVGPCKAAPQIITGPDNVENVTGDDVVLMCEAQGNPIPFLSWKFTRVDGESINLPGDDMSISMISRGGPEKQQVTGWLQVVHAQKRHEGDYTCTAHTDRGTDEKTGRVKIVEHETVLRRVKRLDEEGEL